MDQRTTFRFEAGDIRFELTGSEDFVRKNLPQFLPMVGRVLGIAATETGAAPGAAPAGAPAAAAPAAPAPAAEPAAPADLRTWYERHVPPASRISMQDQILVFAYFMRGFRKFIFTSEDIRRGFEDIGQTEPKSLLQILGTLKRDHNLILGTERRGEYMLNTTGINRVREILGIPKPGAPRDAGGAARTPSDAERTARSVLDL